jgi:hypothetical protein
MRMEASGSGEARTVAEQARSREVEAMVNPRVLAVLACVVFAVPAAAAERVDVPSGVVTVELARPAPAVDEAAMVDWVRGSAAVVAQFYGRFPMARTRVVVSPVAGEGVSGGRTWADARGALIRIRVGVATTAKGYANDWVLVHEMTHLALPSLPENQAWLEEGLATYVESIARAQAGALSAEQVWAGFVKGMPNGLPAAGDHGLDRTPTWGRTYWGGALFCLLADLEIRRATDGRRGLPDALRGMLARGNLQTESTAAAVLATGDRAVGVAVLLPLYERMKGEPVATDLPALWARLGIVPAGRSVRFDDGAPEAALRRALTDAPSRP